MNIFFKSALLLIVVAFLGECIEFLINLVLARELGEEGLGLYMSILPTIIFVVVIASLELPISISKFVAEKDVVFHRSMLMHALKFATVCTIIFSVIAVLFLPLIPVFERYHPFVPWLIILLIPTIAFSSVARGYFMGAQRMSKIAIANFLKRAGQLGLLVFIFTYTSFEAETALLVALGTLIASEILVLGYLFIAFILQMRVLKKGPRANLNGKKVRKSLLEVSIPTTGLRIFHAATFAIKPFFIKETLVRAGMIDTVAMVQYGKMAGVAFTIGFFPAFIAHSLLIVLIPTVSEAYANKDLDRLRSLLRKVMILTFIYGIPAVYLFYFWADPLTALFFEDSPAVRYLQLLVPYFLFHFFVIPMQAYLIGLGLVKDAFLHALYSTVLSFALMYFLGSMPSLQMDGIIIGMNASAVLLTLLHYVTICKKINVDLLLRKRN
ncbi:polysaccharide biosynthesis protein [Halalkalibacter akibai]|uniref:Stage V sporulation protein B n=1 Tax=Halalkalibacter akibai (strain ATCC 43226 / DSM 21942 / CIP 109018 / JCM 9157 / 1139) TaxID=1236973 RepID=W4QY53_HALA3|nr:polysaccharide biosynthesis protein [Halalkalibacter akibai]GAE37011.1 stage V sporulation protein B [Halalkalibacter akibai JCM 9157]